MKKIIILILLAVVLGAAFVSNPSKEQHEDALSQTIEQSIGGGSKEGGILGGLKRLGTKFVSGLASELISSRIDYHNYFIFSTTTFSVGGQEHTLSWGLFGQVVIRDTDALVDELL